METVGLLGGVGGLGVAQGRIGVICAAGIAVENGEASEEVGFSSVNEGGF
jgi:hypothetical protein